MVLNKFCSTQSGGTEYRAPPNYNHFYNLIILFSEEAKDIIDSDPSYKSLDILFSKTPNDDTLKFFFKSQTEINKLKKLINKIVAARAENFLTQLNVEISKIQHQLDATYDTKAELEWDIPHEMNYEKPHPPLPPGKNTSEKQKARYQYHLDLYNQQIARQHRPGGGYKKKTSASKSNPSIKIKKGKNSRKTKKPSKSIRGSKRKSKRKS